MARFSELGVMEILIPYVTMLLLALGYFYVIILGFELLGYLGLFQTLCFLLPFSLPANWVYTRSSAFEKALHRLRVFAENLLYPFYLWQLFNRSSDFRSIDSLLMGAPTFLLFAAHARCVYLGCRDINDYPFGPQKSDTFRLVYWKPARETRGMLACPKLINAGLLAFLSLAFLAPLVAPLSRGGQQFENSVFAAFSLRWLYTVLFAALRALVYWAGTVHRRGTDNEIQLAPRMLVWLFILLFLS